MWIGTMEGGLNFYDHSSGKITAFTEDEGLVNNTINYISEDASGQLWLSTNQGIVRFDPRKRVYKNFNLHNGLQTMEFNVNSGARLASGELVFGSINGFNLVNPKAVRFNRNKPRVLITALELFNRPVHARAKNSPLKQIISTTDTLKLTYSQSIFTLRFAALDYTMPSNNRYAYKLEGFDEQWRLANDQPEATYTKLDPGSYVFKVKGSNNDGVWNPTPAELTIVIEPPYWMTWWFRILIVCLAGGLLMIAYNYRMQYFKKQRFQLQTLVKQRTARIIAQTEEVQHLNAELETNSTALQLQSEELKSKAETLERVNAELIQQKAEEKKARHEADLANQAKSTFLATMSHEIRTPMNGVLGMASLLRETEMTAEQREYTDAILNSGDSLLNVINDILDFTKIESGHMELDHHAFNLNKCVADALEMFSSKKANPKVQLHYYIDPAVPKEILTDSHRLKQVLTNLVGNAVKFTREGEILVSITGDKNPDQTWSLSFSVKDTGIGIPQDKIAELFTPFRQIDSSMSRKYGGSGLGLVISQRLVALLGGSMKVESELGRGSVFSFGIRCSSLQEQNSTIAPDLASATDVQEKNVLSAVLARDFPFKILVAEDNLMNQRLILRILDKLGYHPDIANDGLEALEMLKKQYYELILMDVQMPNLDGLETTRRIRQTYGGKPLIIAMTANVLNEDKQNCFQAGVNSYIAKPLDLDLFVSTLKNLHKLR
jgi:signal transduction histidine kinase